MNGVMIDIVITNIDIVASDFFCVIFENCANSIEETEGENIQGNYQVEGG